MAIAAAASRVTVVTTRRWDKGTSRYSDYSAKLGLDYISELKDSRAFPPYLHVESDKEQLFKTLPVYNGIDNFPGETLVEALKDESYIQNLNGRLLGDYAGDVVVFIHGFNSSLESAKNDGEQIADALPGKKVVVFDWASTNSGSLVDIGRYYAKDSESAMTSVRALTWLLHVLLSRHGFQGYCRIGEKYASRLRNIR
jgi:hypothetical protein